MKIEHDALVMVVDGGKMLLFRNEGDSASPKLQVEQAMEHNNPPDREQASDAPARNHGGAGGLARSAVEQTNFHDLREARFAAEATNILNKRALTQDYEQLIIIAPPQTLGQMRKHYHKELQSRLIGEIGKDLTGHPVPDIEQAITQI